MRYLVGFVFALALGVMGCGETTGADPDFADYQLLLECGDDSVCPSAWAQHIEGGFTCNLQRVECLLMALRDRTPGRYTVELSEANASGDNSFRHVFVITPSAAVETAVVHNFYDVSTDYLPTRLCNPKSPAFFTDCLAKVQQRAGNDPNVCDTGASGGAWNCVYLVLGEGPPWFEDCVLQSPTCGSENAFEVQEGSL